MGSEARTRASNAVVAVVGLFTGLLSEAEQEREEADTAERGERRANEEYARLFEQLGEVLDQHAPGLANNTHGKRTPALIVMAIGAVVGQLAQSAKAAIAGLVHAREEADQARGALAEALRAMGVQVNDEMILPELVAYAGERLASYAALFQKKRQPLPSGSGEVVEAARVLVKALGDKHSHAGDYWKRLSRAVKALGKPSPSAAYRKAERAAADFAIRYYQEAQPTVGRRGTTFSGLYDIGEALVEAEAEIDTAAHEEIARPEPAQVPT